MKTITLLAILICCNNCFAQFKDTVIYFNDSQIVTSKDKALEYIEVTRVTNNTFVQAKWERSSTKDDFYSIGQYEEIRIPFRDTVYYQRTILHSCCNKKNYHTPNETKIVYKEADGIYDIQVYSAEGNLVSEGKSLLPLPIIWHGETTFYNLKGLMTRKVEFSEGIKLETTYFDGEGRVLVNPMMTPDQEATEVETGKAFDEFLPRYLGWNYNYAPEAKEDHQMPVVLSAFIISKTGEIECIHFLRDEHEALHKTVYEVLSKIPKLNPAIKDGEPVNRYYFYPIRHFLR